MKLDCELLRQRDELLNTLKSFHVAVSEHADFSNGVTCSNGVIDEGQVRGCELLKEVRDVIDNYDKII